MTCLSASALLDDPLGCALLRETVARPKPAGAHPWRRACLGFVTCNMALIAAVLMLGQSA
ncbi:MAG TPA: hypothetical protein VIL65_13680 [Beijerinckiaceae bacterium]|jgi:hypothetical protein